MNLLGILTVPAVLPFCMAGSADVRIPTTALLVKLALLVLLPFAIGSSARRVTSARKPGALLGYVPSLCVILTVYASFSASCNEFFGIGLRALPPSSTTAS